MADKNNLNNGHLMKSSTTECNKPDIVQSKCDASVDEIDGSNCKDVSQTPNTGGNVKKATEPGVGSESIVESDVSTVTVTNSHESCISEMQLRSGPEIPQKQTANGFVNRISESEELSVNACHPEPYSDNKSTTNENVKNISAENCEKETVPDECMDTEREASQLILETTDKPSNSPVKCMLVSTESEVSSVPNLPTSNSDVEAVKIEPEQVSSDSVSSCQSSLPFTSQDQNGSVIHKLSHNENLDVSTSEMEEGTNPNNNDLSNKHSHPLPENDNKQGVAINGALSSNENSSNNSSEKGREESMEASQVAGVPVMMEINIKQEPPDEGYLQVEQSHRGGPLVVYSSDSEADSSSSGSALPPVKERLEEVEEIIDDEEVKNKKGKTNQIPAKTKLRTEGEVFPEELPPLEYLTLSPDESVQLEPLGVISGIVDILVVVKANDNSPALYDDTILFVEGRKPLGLIFETFGTVEKPYYSVRFNKASDITEHGLTVGQKVFFAPKADNLTKYVFIAELRKIKCDDASWKDDNEVPVAHRDYSDDEEERREKRRAQNKDRGQNNENGAEVVNKRKKKRRPQHDNPPDPAQPRLLPGELNRNPFGTTGQRYRAPTSNPWPPKSVTNGFSPRGSEHRPPFRPPVPSSPSPGYQNAPTRPPTSFSFGENPRWPSESGQQRTPGLPSATPVPSGPPPFVFTGQPRFGPPPGQMKSSTSSHMPFSTRVPPPNFSSFSQITTPPPSHRYNSPMNSFTPSHSDAGPHASPSPAGTISSPAPFMRPDLPQANGGNSNVFSGQPMWPTAPSAPFRPPTSHGGIGNPSSHTGFGNPSSHTSLGNAPTYAGMGNPSSHAGMANPTYASMGNLSQHARMGNPSSQIGHGNPTSQSHMGNPPPFIGMGNPLSQANMGNPGMGSPSTFNPSLPPPRPFSTSQPPPTAPAFSPYHPPPPCRQSFPSSSRWTDCEPH